MLRTATFPRTNSALILYRVIIDSKDRRLCREMSERHFASLRWRSRRRNGTAWTKKDQDQDQDQEEEEEEEEEEEAEEEESKREKTRRSEKRESGSRVGKNFHGNGGWKEKGDRSFRFPCFRRFVTEYTSARGGKKKEIHKKGRRVGPATGEGRNARKRSFERQGS